MFKKVGDKWFNSRSPQMNLRAIPRLPVFARSSHVRRQTEGKSKLNAKPFVVGESVVGGDEVAM